MFFKSKEKVFCIGLNKTGTTTIEQVLKNLGYQMGNQRDAELLLEDWSKRDYKKIIKYCKKGQAFQDVPFSLPYTFIILHNYFPNAKFILTIRDSADQWYRSLVNFHSKLWGNNDGAPPTKEQLLKANYIFTGRPYFANRLQFSSPDNDLYNEEALKKYYNSHIYSVKKYFQHIPHKYMEVNVSDKNDYLKLCDFLGKKPLSDNFPWLNQTYK